jgi:DNA-binding CsgD family transcriptional regulator
MQFLRCIELMQRGEPVSVGRVAAVTRTSRETVRDWMRMLQAHGRAEQLGRAVEPQPARRGAPPEWWRWTAAPRGAADLERTAIAAGMQSALNMGSGSCVYSDGCHGVTQEHLQLFASLVRGQSSRRNPWGLTPREAEVMDAVCAAGSHKQAARVLGISDLTVKTATYRIGKKMRAEGSTRYVEWDQWRRDGQGAPE